MKAKKPIRERPAFIHIGLTEGAVRALADGMKAIVQMKGSERVKLAAIKALKEGSIVTGTTISGCSFSNEPL